MQEGKLWFTCVAQLPSLSKNENFSTFESEPLANTVYKQYNKHIFGFKK